jgi:hypothetical protein
MNCAVNRVKQKSRGNTLARLNENRIQGRFNEPENPLFAFSAAEKR